MEQYQKPVMKIIELEELDILTLSASCEVCTSSDKKYFLDQWKTHMRGHGAPYSTYSDAELKAIYDTIATEPPPKTTTETTTTTTTTS